MANHIARAVAAPASAVFIRANVELAQLEADTFGRARSDARVHTAVAHAVHVSESLDRLETEFAPAIDLFQYLSEYKVLVYRLCKYTVPPS